MTNALDYLPLAIKQATDYIRATNTSSRTISGYSKDDGYQTEGNTSRDTHDELQNSITLTSQISFEQIGLQRLATANVLSHMNNLNREDIPADLLTPISLLKT